MIDTLRRAHKALQNKPTKPNDKASPGNVIKAISEKDKHAEEIRVLKAMVSASVHVALQAEVTAKAALAAVTALTNPASTDAGPTAKRIAARPVPAGWERKNIHCVERRSA